MPVSWPTFISNVESYIIAADENKDRSDFGEHVAKEYHTAIKQSMSVYGQTHVSISNSGLVSTYRTEFDRMQEEPALEPPLTNTLDEDGNEIPFTGRTSDPDNPNPADPDPDYADPDMEEVQPPVIDPVKMRLFIDEYGSEYNLHKYEFFEFCLTGDETKDELVAILSNRILFSFMLESSGGVREKMVGWIDSIKTWEEGELLDGTKAAYSAFKNLVIKAIKAGGYDDVYILDKVRYRTIQKLFSSYGVTALEDSTNNVGLNTSAKNGKPTEMIYHASIKKDFVVEFAQVPFDPDNTNEDYEVSPVLTQEFIAYFSFTGRDKASEWKDAQVTSEYIEGELENKWTKIVEPESVDDVVDNKNRAAPYMYTRQQTVDALEGIEPDEEGEDPYEMLAEETILYWKTAGDSKQPLKATPPAPPCLSSSPLNGKYITVYTGSKKKLAEGLRKALNAGKESDNIQEAANMVATALSVAYAKHLMELKFIYLGGIPVPLVPYVPMIGFVPNVF